MRYFRNAAGNVIESNETLETMQCFDSTSQEITKVEFDAKVAEIREAERARRYAAKLASPKAAPRKRSRYTPMYIGEMVKMNEQAEWGD